MVQLMLEDVTLIKGPQITAHIRFKGGATRTLVLPIPPTAWQMRQTEPEVIREVDRLLNDHTDEEIAIILNQRGLRSGCGKPLDRLIVRYLRQSYGLTDRFARLRAAGMLTLHEMARYLGVCTKTVNIWRRHGLLRAFCYNDKGDSLYELPKDTPVKWKHKLGRQQNSDESRERGAV